jgi:hypothetical protein
MYRHCRHIQQFCGRIKRTLKGINCIEHLGGVLSMPALYSGRPDSNTGQETGYPDSLFSSLLPNKIQDCVSDYATAVSFHILSNSYSLTILPLDASLSGICMLSRFSRIVRTLV